MPEINEIMYKKDEQVYQQLDWFVGIWNTEGIIPSSNNNPEVKIKGTDTYEWIMDGFFLLHTADVMIGNDNSKTHEIIGFDRLKNHYTMQHYNNKGNAGQMTATLDDGLWTFTGDDLRFKGGFSKKGNLFSGVWEQLIDRKIWTHLMDITLSKKH